VPIKSTKLEMEWKNFCRLNDLKKKDDKIVFEAYVNIPNNEIQVIRHLG